MAFGPTIVDIFGVEIASHLDGSTNHNYYFTFKQQLPRASLHKWKFSKKSAQDAEDAENLRESLRFLQISPNITYAQAIASLYCDSKTDWNSNAKLSGIYNNSLAISRIAPFDSPLQPIELVACSESERKRLQKHLQPQRFMVNRSGKFFHDEIIPFFSLFLFKQKELQQDDEAFLSWTQTMIMNACNHGSVEILKIVLLDNEYKHLVHVSEHVHKTLLSYISTGFTPRHETALERACSCSRICVVEYLLSRGADPNASNASNNRGPLRLAVARNDDAMAKVLLEHGAKIIDGLLYRCPIFPSMDMLQLLVQYGFNLNAKNGIRGDYFIQDCVRSSRCCTEEILNFVIENGADVDVIDENGMTPLMCAVQRGRSDSFIAILASLTKRINHCSNNQTALDLANQIKNGCLENELSVVDILKQHGAKSKSELI